MRRKYSTRFGTQRRKGGILLPLLILLTVAGGIAWFLFFETESPDAKLSVKSKYLGTDSTISIDVVDNESGVKSVELKAFQGDSEQVLYNKEYPRTGYHNPVGPREHAVRFQVDSKKLGFNEGPVTLQLTVLDFSLNGWFQGNQTVVTRDLIIDTEAPKIQILHVENSISPGQSGIAVFKVSDLESTSGVQLNDNFFTAYPVTKNSKDTFITYFALPYNAVNIREMSITTTDLAGNTTRVPFATRFKAVSKQKDTINISDSFLNRKIPEFQQYYPEMEGSYLDRYIYINNTIRKQNARKIKEICTMPVPDKLWTGDFLRMHGTNKANFADYRSYVYDKQVIDHQVHLGIDIASVKRDNVKAANTGRVKWADYLGIYGYMVILDHGQGVYSLYSHLSQINVRPGDTLQKGTLIGLTGATGMAGGDHLHFSMLINGIFVNPREWWDKNWVENNVEGPLRELRFIPARTEK
ncbi:M23 family metallopeptidase [Desulforhopalus vacuolatus]|uniref:M23 family metallopeptidase n=1 Tax=Desulforhopalus vacuolatus TaxID=40414 RepID=UPI001966BA48|nr:M23 family metallopeptidase [Desulforhopalus vacuolatus]MBM9519024.1 M23 family metallopeptidase [Desulforhopalus vacuolatus]